jgi:two-component system, OmpR family, response regulator
MAGMSEAEPEARLLVVEDEPNILELLSASLRLAGFEVATATGGLEALQAVQRHRPDLVVLDVMLPDLDGFDVARRLRSGNTRTPVLFLTARDATHDKVTGLTLGGDDYVTKPFSLEEVIARIRAVCRRGHPPGEGDVLRFADLELDEETHEVTRAGVQVRLTATEFRLLRHLMLHPRQVRSKSQILEAVWGYGFDGDDNVVETYVSYLRRKLDPLGPPLIHTIRLVGYSLRLPHNLSTDVDSA